MSITIETDWLNQIKSKVGYPYVTEDLLLDDDQIKLLCIKPALYDYFTKFPKKEIQEISVTQEVSVDFPDSFTIGVIDIRVVEKGGIQGSNGSSFWDLVYFNTLGGGGSAYTTRGTRIRGYNPNGLWQTRYDRLQVKDAMTNLGTYKYRVDHENSKVYIYSSTSSKGNLIWAKWSEDFNDIKFQFKYDVVKLSQAYYLEHLADSAGLVIDSASEVTIDTSALLDKAEKLKEKVFEKWNEYPSIHVLRQ